MSRRISIEREAIIESGSALRWHSLNQYMLGIQLDGERRAFGEPKKAKNAREKQERILSSLEEERKIRIVARVAKLFSDPHDLTPEDLEVEFRYLSRRGISKIPLEDGREIPIPTRVPIRTNGSITFST